MKNLLNPFSSRARKENRIRDDLALLIIIKHMCKFRSAGGTLLSYDWICIPLVYTQVCQPNLKTSFRGQILPA